MDMISIRRKLMAFVPNVSPGVLPAEYQQVDYLDSTLTGSRKTYIDTGVIPTQNTRIIAEGNTLNDVSSANFIFGSRYSATSQRFWFNVWLGYYKCGLGNAQNADILRASRMQNFVCDYNHNANHQVTVNGVDGGEISIPTSETYQYPIFLFAGNSKGNADDQLKPTRISKFALYDDYMDSEPIMDLIPCYKKSTRQIGMYDIVSDTFFTNAGTGRFLRGPAIGSHEGFDYLFYADELGTVPPVDITTMYGFEIPTGKTATIAWDMTGYDGRADRVMCSISTSPNTDGLVIYEKDLPSTIGEMTLDTTGQTFISRTYSQQFAYQFMGRYIKLKIND